ncbi:MAG: L-aspartate oxidase [Beutenbergiaceae bacterium]
MTAVLVVGSGIAGLSLALEACELGHQVTVVTKGGLGQSNTRFAQGGIAAAVFDEDSVESHIADTLAAGAGLCDPDAVRVLCAEGPARIAEMIELGVAFDTKDGELAHGLEAAHSYPRVLHAGGDATGAVIEAALVSQLRERNVDIHEHAFLLELTTADGVMSGASVELADGRRKHFAAQAVVLGTGGAGQLYPYTSNPSGATGDGAACAARIGAKLSDVEFYQFHPTTLARPGNFLVSEAVRGEGAVLRDADGMRFMADVPGKELAPRDVVARAVATQMAAQGGTPVVLDATALGADFLQQRFPSIDAGVRAAGLDWTAAPIPITPAAHYWMGGITTDLWGRTSVPGLFAIGECSRTGVHGANRLASNSLLEGSVFGHRAAQVLDTLDDWPQPQELSGFTFPDLPATGSETGPVAPFSRAGLQQLMWDAVGLMRTGTQLREALHRLEQWDIATAEPTDRTSHEDLNLLLLARMCAQAALARTESLGAHYRLDAPRIDDDAAAAAMVNA